MAEHLEDYESIDADRNIDQSSFLASQFEIFTHNYRENVEPECQDEEGGDHSACKHADENARKEKKELVNLTRRLQKALRNLESMKGNEPIFDFLISLKDVNEKLLESIKKNSAEFSTTTISLPDYDETDMKLFLGDDEVEEVKSMVESVKEEQGKAYDEMKFLMAQAEILLQEYDHMKHGISKRL